MTTVATVPQPPTAPKQEAPTVATDTPLFVQSYSFEVPRNMDGVLKIFGDPTTKEVNEKALIYALRAGLKQIINNRVRQIFTDRDDKGNPTFKAVEGTYDATALILEAPKRQVLSQRDKLEKNLKASNMPQALIDTMLKTFDENVGTGDQEQGNTSTDLTDARVYLSEDGKKLVMKVGASSDEDEE